MYSRKQELKATSIALFEFGSQNGVGPTTTNPTTTTMGTFTTGVTGYTGERKNLVKRNSGKSI